MLNDGDELSRRAFVTRGLAIGAALGGLPAAKTRLGSARPSTGDDVSQSVEGAAVGEVRDLPPAGELVHRLWREYEQARG